MISIGMLRGALYMTKHISLTMNINPAIKVNLTCEPFDLTRTMFPAGRKECYSDVPLSKNSLDTVH